MKRNWKRILSLWLTVCMVFTMNFGLGTTAVYAANVTGAVEVSTSATNRDVKIGEEINAENVFNGKIEYKQGDAAVDFGEAENEAPTIAYSTKIGDDIVGNERSVHAQV